MRLATTAFVTHAMVALTHRSLHEIAERHEPVIEVLRAGDAAGAEAAMRHHIQEPGEWIRDAMASRPLADSSTRETNRGIEPDAI